MPGEEIPLQALGPSSGVDGKNEKKVANTEFSRPAPEDAKAVDEVTSNASIEYQGPAGIIYNKFKAYIDFIEAYQSRSPTFFKVAAAFNFIPGEAGLAHATAFLDKLRQKSLTEGLSTLKNFLIFITDPEHNFGARSRLMVFDTIAEIVKLGTLETCRDYKNTTDWLKELHSQFEYLPDNPEKKDVVNALERMGILTIDGYYKPTDDEQNKIDSAISILKGSFGEYIKNIETNLRAQFITTKFKMAVNLEAGEKGLKHAKKFVTHLDNRLFMTVQEFLADITHIVHEFGNRSICMLLKSIDDIFETKFFDEIKPGTYDSDFLIFLHAAFIGLKKPFPTKDDIKTAVEQSKQLYLEHLDTLIQVVSR